MIGTKVPSAPASAGPTERVWVLRALRKAVSFPVLLGALLVAGTFAATSGGRFFADGDTWWHLASGQRILATGTWPTSATYSFTVSGNTWIVYEWLGDVAIALAARLGGWRGLAALL